MTQSLVPLLKHTNTSATKPLNSAGYKPMTHENVEKIIEGCDLILGILLVLVT
jgi:hypothetical protein